VRKLSALSHQLPALAGGLGGNGVMPMLAHPFAENAKERAAGLKEGARPLQEGFERYIFLLECRYWMVSAMVAKLVVAVTPLLDCAVTVIVYVPAGVAGAGVGPWFK